MADASSPTQCQDLPRLPRRRPDAHKGDSGRVAIIAGSRDMTGAACLCGRAALRGGAGLVKVFTPQSAHPVVAASEMCYMTNAVEEDGEGRISRSALNRLLEGAAWADALAIGPGLGQSDEIREWIPSVLSRARGPVVLDADGLNAVAQAGTWWTARRAPTIVTPHPGEMARLRAGAGLAEIADWDEENRLIATAEYSMLTGSVVVLKGRGTVVFEPGGAYFVNTSGNPGLATGGTGDVLTGLIAALVGQKLPAFDAARLAVYCHGAAADLLAKTVGPFGFLAREVADELPGILAAQIA